MRKMFSTLSKDISTYSKNIETTYPDDYSMVSELSIKYISQHLMEAKEEFESRENVSPQEEVFYFKNIKCHLYAMMLYHLYIKDIEINKPPLKKKKLKKYYLKELFKIKTELNKKSFYYNYYKTGATHMDHQFFKRMDQDIFVSIEKYLLHIDCRYTTPTIHLFSKIEAYDKLRNHLKKKIKKYDKKRVNQEAATATHTLAWTSSKTDLIELIYAFHAAGVFNNGKAEIKEIAQYFQETLNIDLGQYNRVFYDIRMRKINKTKSLDLLKDALLKRMKETENQLFI